MKGFQTDYSLCSNRWTVSSLPFAQESAGKHVRYSKRERRFTRVPQISPIFRGSTRALFFFFFFFVCVLPRGFASKRETLLQSIAAFVRFSLFDRAEIRTRAKNTKEGPDSTNRAFSLAKVYLACVLSRPLQSSPKIKLYPKKKGVLVTNPPPPLPFFSDQ